LNNLHYRFLYAHAYPLQQWIKHWKGCSIFIGFMSATDINTKRTKKKNFTNWQEARWMNHTIKLFSFYPKGVHHLALFCPLPFSKTISTNPIVSRISFLFPVSFNPKCHTLYVLSFLLLFLLQSTFLLTYLAKTTPFGIWVALILVLLETWSIWVLEVLFYY
jgi:hypothetical protein